MQIMKNSFVYLHARVSVIKHSKPCCKYSMKKKIPIDSKVRLKVTTDSIIIFEQAIKG